MITFLSIQEAYKTKIERQQRLKGLKYRCHGSCAYTGRDISPGCYGCFHSDALFLSFMLGRDFGLPNVCNRDCVYCFEPHQVSSDFTLPAGWKLSPGWQESILRDLPVQKRMISTPVKMQYYEFSGTCEPLFYMPLLREVMQILRGSVDPQMGARGWAKVYTNGTLLDESRILALKEMGFDEVRVHPAADGFSSAIFNNIKTAARYIPVVTVETPSWPPHREKLLQMLPVIEEAGVKHLDICQVEITHPQQFARIEKALREVRLYQAFYPVMDDGGLVEEIMAEAIKNNYKISVLDCNGFVKQSRAALSTQSYWSILNRKFPAEWEKQRYDRNII